MVALEKYRDPWLAEKVNDVIGFYPREFYCFDNFSAFAIMWKGQIYPTVEHAYQAASFMGSDNMLAEKIRNAASPDEAKRIKAANFHKRRKTWEKEKLAVMEELLRLKVAQHPFVLKKLLETGDLLIVEDSPIDSYWGWGKNRDGQNELGKLWMKIRNEYQVKSILNGD